MRGAISSLSLVRPRTIHEALRALRDDNELVPLAGCTDLYVALNFGTLAGSKFLDLWPLERLRKIEVVGDGVLRIGALARFTDIILSRRVKTLVPMLVDASKQIGGPQIQNRGTIGGNIANASPAGDSLPVLAATDAVVVLASQDAGQRRVKFTEFYTGYRKTARKADELILAVEIPRVSGTQWFRKVGTRQAQAISKVVMAGVRSDTPRMAFGSVAATTVRVPKTEAALASGKSIDEAVKVFEKEIKPIDDVRSTAEYRMTVASNLVRRFWADTA